jgi:MFS family permease
MLELLASETEELENISLKKGASEYKNTIVKLCLFQFFIGFYLISAVLIPFYLIWAQISLFEISILQTIYMIGIVIFGVPCGAIADKLGRKYCLFLAGLSSAIAALIYGTLSNLIIFVIAEIFFAFGTAMMTGSAESYAYDYLKTIGKHKKYPKISAKIQSFYLLGVIISAPIGTILAYFLYFPIVMMLMAIPYMISAIIALTLKKVKSRENKAKNLSKLIFSGFRKIQDNKTVKIIAIDLILFEALVMILVFYYPFYLYETLKVPIVFIGIFSSILNITQIIIMNLIMNYATRVENRKMLFRLCAIIPGVLYILLALILQTSFIIACILFIIGIGLSRRILSINAINKQIEKEHRTTILSTIEICIMMVEAFIIPTISFLVLININGFFIISGSLLILLTVKSRIKNHQL